MAGLEDYRDEPQFRSALRSVRAFCGSDGSLSKEGLNCGNEPASEQIGRYTVKSRDSSSGSTIYRAVDTTEKIVWIKRLPRGARDSEIGSFMNSYTVLQHPNLARVIEVVGRQGIDYVVFDLGDGLNLKKLVAGQGSLEPSIACEMIRQVALGVSFLHHQSLTHGQVTSPNVVLTSTGNVKLLEPKPSSTDRRKDVQGMGHTLFFLLTGLTPRVGANGRIQPPSVVAPVKARVLDLAIHMCSGPSDRFRNLDELIRQLATYCDVVNWRNFIRLIELQTMTRDRTVFTRQTEVKRP
jgi:hypothetical protein